MPLESETVRNEPIKWVIISFFHQQEQCFKPLLSSERCHGNMSLYPCMCRLTPALFQLPSSCFWTRTAVQRRFVSCMHSIFWLPLLGQDCFPQKDVDPSAVYCSLYLLCVYSTPFSVPAADRIIWHWLNQMEFGEVGLGWKWVKTVWKGHSSEGWQAEAG